MEMSRRLIALVLFALTQLFAPLVHAHVDGIQGEASFHTYDTPRNLASLDDSQTRVESYESQAISIPQQYHGNDALIIPTFLASSTHPLPPAVARIADRPRNPLRASESKYHKPHTQAPPA